MDSLVVGDLLVILVRIGDRTVFDTDATTGTLVFFDVTSFFENGYFKVSCFSLYTVNFCVGEYFYIWMPADLDQFRCENSHRAVIGREGLVELGHVAANTRCLFYKVDLKPCGGEVKRSLNAADAAADDHDVAEVFVTGHAFT